MNVHAGPDWTDILTALVAIYAAGLSTYTFIIRRQEHRSKVNVKVSTGLLGYSTGTSPLMLLLEFSNPGNVPATIAGFGMELRDGTKLAYIQPQSHVSFPHTLEMGKSCTAWDPVRSMAKRLHEKGYSGCIRLRPYCTDQIGKTYWGKDIMFDVDKWLGRDRTDDGA